MSIVISQKVRLVMTDTDVVDFDLATTAIEVAITQSIDLQRESLSIAGRGETVSATSNRVAPMINTGYNGVTFKFSTYLKPTPEGANTVAAEKLLWESLSVTDTVDATTTSTITFTSGNTNKLRELFFYMILEDGSYYKINNAVVNSVSIAVDINNPTLATWEIYALTVNYVSPGSLAGTPKDYTSQAGILRNKLSTVSLGIGATNYALAITKANLVISNNTSFINRVRVGEILNPTGHYVSSRTSKLDLSFYLNTQANGSSSLLSALLGYTTLSQVNTLANVGISLGGATNSLKIDINMPTSKLVLRSPEDVGKQNSVDISATPQESILGAGDEINIVYTDTT